MFPRFYFVSDPTLLEILSLGSDPPSVCPHFQSGLFDSVTAIEFDKEDKYKMLKMFSQQNEEVAFQTFIAGEGGHGHLEEKPVIATGNIESWLQALVDGMQDPSRASSARHTTRCRPRSSRSSSSATPRRSPSWVSSSCGQTTCNRR
jgi:dynein heavy chain